MTALFVLLVNIQRTVLIKMAAWAALIATKYSRKISTKSSQRCTEGLRIEEKYPPTWNPLSGKKIKVNHQYNQASNSSNMNWLMLTLYDCEDDIVVDQLLPELPNSLLLLNDLRLLSSLFLGQVLHFYN